MIYLDHAATTPMHPEVIRTMNDIMENYFGNPSSIHGFGRNAHAKLEGARQVIADSLGVKSHEIIFTSGGTESDNMAIIQTAQSRKEQGKHIITTAIEHPAVLNSMKYLASQGFEVTYLPVDPSGQLQLTDFEQALRDDTILVSIMFANNETGNILPIPEIGARLAEHPAVFHTDAVQAYGKLALRPYEWNVDLLSVAGHKINGPKGIGFLYQRDGVKLPQLFHGGEQEEKRRPGTENLAAICGMATASMLHNTEEQQREKAMYQTFSQTLVEILQANQIAFSINGDQQNKLPHILNLHFKHVNSDLLLMKLDLRGYAVSTGSACTAGNVEPSHVLQAMVGTEDSAVYESIRISFGYGNTMTEVEEFSKVLAEIVQQTQK